MMNMALHTRSGQLSAAQQLGNTALQDARKENKAMQIIKAEQRDLNEILSLQYLAYRSEAELVGSYDIPPLKQQLSEVEDEWKRGIILKAAAEDGRIIGSVRGYAENETLYIGKLIVHPDFQGQGIGIRLLGSIEKLCPQARYELFTSVLSLRNIKLYEKAGYRELRREQTPSGLALVYLQKLARTE